ncbi:MAG: cytochrome c3 family protein [Candidatus Marinimicrobia bacterium]|jgi:hypothetical protein|nr:hypothetical protein [Candidatus Neomarinimicrobiota bacterium]MCP4930352.1 cytochrome c3 family protein [Candidatus Neomarinimicrobiota bacterium]MDP6033465.1 cytochrome c3 family protein [Candidatus Neomarinimicrobiota bacterium]MDP6201273.1 cytochrome c3 family protein [Candidatus Neomarinimicrobiota bacterium]MDP7331215.1 cytochrome c3 family protein [Candidatus Neomarinimicrobiota bacterium]|tara:strand:- start:7811 stop:8449 length:639 start_codon:yes stop_codon:yes gene_type:complete
MDKLLNKQFSTIIGIMIVVGVIISFKNSSFHIPGNQEDYQPTQPIAFSHQLHAGEMEIACQYCHFGAEDSKHAGIPPANVCMNCHKFVNNTFNETRRADLENRKPVFSKEIKKIYASLGLDLDGKKVNDEIPTEWVKVHNVPDFVFFSHKPHITAGVDCAKCHGDVQTMTQVKQVEDLSMGWCLDCHRQEHDSIQSATGSTAYLQDCASCHY